MNKLLACVLAGLLVASCGGGGSAGVISTLPYRAGVQPIYYGNIDRTSTVVASETQAIWTEGWGPDGYETHIVRQLQAAQALGVSFATTLGVVTVMQVDGQEVERIRGIFTLLRSLGLLTMVKVLYPVDEPEQQGFSDAMLKAATDKLRLVAAEFPELNGVKIAVIYGCGNTFVGYQHFDRVGCDRYDHSAQDNLDDLIEKAPGKEWMFLIGGVEPYKADPRPYLALAMKDTRIVSMVYFIRYDFAAVGLGRGIESNGLAPLFCGVSKTLLTQRLVESC
jgi:hypothetical protein